jgi:hypothetical protein
MWSEKLGTIERKDHFRVKLLISSHHSATVEEKVVDNKRQSVKYGRGDLRGACQGVARSRSHWPQFCESSQKNIMQIDDEMKSVSFDMFHR